MEVKLKKNGWHKQLQVWTFGKYTPEFNSLCPFFWTTVFCALVSPFVATYKYLIKLPLIKLSYGAEFAVSRLINIIETVIQYLDVQVCQPVYEKKVSNYVEAMTDDDALDIYSALYNLYDYKDDLFISNDPYLKRKWDDTGNKTYRAYLDKLTRWKNKTGEEWQTRLMELAKQRETRKLEEARLLAIWETEQEAKKKRLAKTFNVIAYYTKYLVYLGLGVVGVYALYFLALFGLFVYEGRSIIAGVLNSFLHFLHTVFVDGGPYVLMVLAGLAVLAPLVILTVKLLVKCNLFQVSRSAKPSKLYRFLAKLDNGIHSVVGFCVMYAQAAKQNYCPHIDWEE